MSVIILVTDSVCTPDTRANIIIIIIIINKVLIKVTLNKVIAGALYIVICGWNAVKVLHPTDMRPTMSSNIGQPYFDIIQEISAGRLMQMTGAACENKRLVK